MDSRFPYCKLVAFADIDFHQPVGHPTIDLVKVLFQRLCISSCFDYLRTELFFGNVGIREWLASIMGSKDYGTIRKISKYIKKGITHRELFVRGRGVVLKLMLNVCKLFFVATALVALEH
jgi:hypothetical protein